MLNLPIGRRAVLRDLDATISQMRGLSSADRDRPTPCNDWAVRHLAAHMAESTRSVSWNLMQIIRARTGSENPTEQAGDEQPDAAWNTILARLTTGRNQLAHVLANLAEDDMTTKSGTADSMTGHQVLNEAVLEYGLHRSDLEAALGEEAGLDVETIEAADDVYGRELHMIAADAMPTGPHTDPFALNLRGDELMDRWLVWTGAEWSDARTDEPITRIHGSDSAVTLFITGRIPLDDHRLDVTGDRDLAGRFVGFVPGS